MCLIKWMGRTNENESPNPGRSLAPSLGSPTEMLCFPTPFFFILFGCSDKRPKRDSTAEETPKTAAAAAATKQVQSQRYFKRPAQSSQQREDQTPSKPKKQVLESIFIFSSSTKK